MIQTKSVVMLFSLVMFGLLVACTAEVASEPTATTGPSLASVLSEEPAATTSTVESTITPSPTPEPSSTRVLPTATDISEVATEQPTKTKQQAQPTDAATEAPTNIPVENVTLRILPQSINLRRGPGVIYRVIGYLFEGDKVAVLARDRTGTWYNVLTQDDVNGWVAASVTEFLSDKVVIDSIEIAATIPVPPTFTPTATPTLTPTSTPVPSSGGGGSRRKTPKPPTSTDEPYPPPSTDEPPPPTENPYP